MRISYRQLKRTKHKEDKTYVLGLTDRHAPDLEVLDEVWRPTHQLSNGIFASESLLLIQRDPKESE
jgi:hypothetical protein